MQRYQIQKRVREELLALDNQQPRDEEMWRPLDGTTLQTLPLFVTGPGRFRAMPIGPNGEWLEDEAWEFALESGRWVVFPKEDGVEVLPAQPYQN